MALLDEARVHLRIMSEETDAEIETHIAAALRDMRRLGVREELLNENGTMDPLAKQAVFMYCKAHYGYDNSEAVRFSDDYRMTVTALMHSDACDEDDEEG